MVIKVVFLIKNKIQCFSMYGKLLITHFFWHLVIFVHFFCCPLMNILFTQFWTGKLLVHKPTSHHKDVSQNRGVANPPPPLIRKSQKSSYPPTALNQQKSYFAPLPLENLCHMWTILNFLLLVSHKIEKFYAEFSQSKF